MTKRNLQYEAASASRLLSKLKGAYDINSDLQHSVEKVRARSRELFQNDPLVRRYEQSLVENVIGSEGIQVKIKGQNNDGKPDIHGNKRLQEAFDSWSQDCGPNDESLLELEQLFIRTVPRDGEILVRFFTNESGLKIQFIPADHLDIQYNDILKNGHKIIGSVEYDQFGAEVAYWLLNHNPNDRLGDTGETRKHTRYPKGEVYFFRRKESISQSRALPWVSVVLPDIYQLKEYFKIVQASAINAASKAIYLTKPRNDGDVAFNTDRVDEDGNPIDDESNLEEGFYDQIQYGSMDIIPDGYTFNSFQPAGQAIDSSYVKILYNRIASGLSVSYLTLTSDASGGNYAQMRSNSLQEKEKFKSLQDWVIKELMTVVYRKWLKHELTFGNTRIPLRAFNKFKSPRYMPKVLDYADPKTQMSMITEKLNLKLTSPQREAEQMGVDYEELLQENAEALRLQEQYGVFPNVKSNDPQAEADAKAKNAKGNSDNKVSIK